MTPFLQLALALAIIILAAKSAGYLSYRLGQPSVLGELMVGILLGPSVLNLFHLPYFTDENLPEVIHQMAEIGVLLLMFIAGLELHLTDLARSGKASALAGILGVIFPLLLGTGAGLAFSMDLLPALFVGLILSATSVSISAQTLLELKVLRTRVGISLLGAAVFDDILVVLGLSIFTALVQPGTGGGLAGVLRILASMLLYLVVVMATGWFLLPRLSRRVSRLPVSQPLISFTIVIILLYGWLAEAMGSMAAITGAFLAGLMLARSPVKERIESGISPIAYGIFVPVFFVNVGLSANAGDLSGSAFWLLVVLVLVAVVGKVLGAGLGARWAGLSRLESLQLGAGMMSRGEVGLIVASVGISQGLIDQRVFAAIVGVVILTTLFTPPALRSLFQPRPAPDERLSQAAVPPPEVNAASETPKGGKP